MEGVFLPCGVLNMSAHRNQAKILLRQQSNGKVEVSCLDPKTGRECRTGLAVEQAHMDAEVRKLKQTLERHGNDVQVREV